MNKAPTCPDPEVLQLLALGQMPPEEVERWAEHCEQCEQCIRALQTPQHTDTLIAVMSTKAPDSNGSDSEAVDALMERLAGLRLAQPSPRPGDSPLERTQLDVSPSKGNTPVPAADRFAVPGYELLGELGCGGMGLVWKARHLALNRVVAVKLLRADPHAEPEHRARFRAEGEAVARLQHPNIVQIYEVGESHGRPYLVLEYVAGGTLADRIGGQPQPPRHAAEIVETIARAVHHAHAQGVIHRDLKPANVLLSWGHGEPANHTASTPRPLDQAVPKIVDFGLARRVEPREFRTETGAILGTPSYMAPEQARGRSRDISPAVDVYALGTILYQLLTGRPPFEGETAFDILAKVWSQEPVPPRQIQPRIHRDLETICLKAMAKEPALRYSSALALADDLHRFNTGESILARRERLSRKLWRKVWKHPGLVGAVLAALVVIATVTWAVRSESSSRHAMALGRALDARLETPELTDAYLEDVDQLVEDLGVLDGDRGDNYRRRLHAVWAQEIARRNRQPKLQPEDYATLKRALDLLARRAPALESPLRHEFNQRLRGWEALFHLATPFEALPRALDPARVQVVNNALQVRQTVAGETLLLSKEPSSGDVQLEAVFDEGWESAAQLGLALNAGAGHTQPVIALAFSPDGRTLATAAGVGGRPGEVILWDVCPARQRAVYRAEKAGRLSLAFDPSGSRVVVANSTDPIVRLLHPDTAADVGSFPGPETGVASVAFDPRGRWLATGSGVANKSGQVTLWETTSWRAKTTLQGPANVVVQLAFAPDGRTLAARAANSALRLWNIDTQVERLALPPVPLDEARLLRFSPDGKTLVAPGFLERPSQDFADRASCGFWDVLTGKGRGIHLGFHSQGMRALAFSPDSRTLAASSAWGDNEVRLLDVTTKVSRTFLAGGLGGWSVTALDFSPDGTLLAMGTQQHGVQLWDVTTGQLRASLGARGYTCVLRVNPDRGTEPAPVKTFQEARTRNGTVLLQILHNEILLGQEERKASQLPPGQLRLAAERQGHRLQFQVNDQPPLRHQFPLPETGTRTGVFGLLAPAGARLVRLLAARQPEPATLSLLERADKLFADAAHAEALVHYQQQAVQSGAGGSDGQEARLKAAQCLFALHRQEEATLLLKRLAAEEGRWPVVAGCQLVVLAAAQGRFDEAIVLFDSLSARVSAQELAACFPLQFVERVVDPCAREFYRSYWPAGGRQAGLRTLERMKALEDWASATAWQRRHLGTALLYAYHMAGKHEEVAHLAEELLSRQKVGFTLGGGDGDRVPLLEQYCWVLRSLGRTEQALVVLEQEMFGRPGMLRREAYRLLPERARLHVALGRLGPAEDDVTEFLRQAPTSRGRYAEQAEAYLALGFLREQRGDAAGARAAWQQGRFDNWSRAKLRLPPGDAGPRLSQMDSQSVWAGLALAVLLGDLAEGEAAEHLTELQDRLLTRTPLGPFLEGRPIPPAVLRELGNSPRAREVARQLAFRALPYADSVRMPVLLLAAEVVRRDAFPDAFTAEQSDLLMRLLDDLARAFFDGTLGVAQAAALTQAWHGVTDELGWGALDNALAPSVRASCAYLLGHRLVRLNKRAEARQLFRMVSADGPDGSPAKRLAAAALANLDKP